MTGSATLFRAAKGSQRWWRALANDTTLEQAQAGVDQLAAKMDSRRRTRDGERTTAGELATGERLHPAPAVAFRQLERDGLSSASCSAGMGNLQEAIALCERRRDALSFFEQDKDSRANFTRSYTQTGKQVHLIYDNGHRDAGRPATPSLLTNPDATSKV
ncbi:hypothetical protein [Amycolatopsis sp. NPDC051128]|uniref:hypothetical protein n=1 Tax=Amycolatopsis sp. NPDC051128 TaxID=3155412 RepID=UPI00343D2CD3